MRKSGRVGGGGVSFIQALESRRLLSAGSLDTSFSSDGKTSISFDTLGVTANGMAVQSDGKIVEVGTASDNSFAVARFNADGTLDTSFGPNGNGKLTIHVGDRDAIDYAHGVAIQADGKIVVVGAESFTSTEEDDNHAFVFRLNADGSRDSTFASNGYLDMHSFDTQTADETSLNAVAIQKDGKIVVAGDEEQGFLFSDKLIVGRLNTNGTVDSTFNSNGKASHDSGDNDDVQAIAIDYNGTASTNSDYGKIVLVGHQTQDPAANIDYFGLGKSDTDRVIIARYNTNGILDTSFAGDGTETTTAGDNAKSTDAEAVAIESGGAIVIAGNAGTNLGSTDHNFYLARFTVNGTLDNTFGSSGHVTTDFGGNDEATSLVIGGFGQQLIAGGTTNGKFALAAYSLNGKPYTVFGTSGKVSTTVDHGTSAITLALAPNHTIVAAGGSGMNTARYFDTGPEVFILATDATAGPTTVKRVGKGFQSTPNPASMLVGQDESLPVNNRIYFTVGGTAIAPNDVSIKIHKDNYTLSGMSVAPSRFGNSTYYVDIPAGETFVTVTLNPQNIPASNTTATFAIQSNPDYAASFPSSQTITILGTNPTPPPTTKTFIDMADSYVQDGSDAADNFGTATKIEVKEGSSGVNRISYLKFDLSSLSTVNSVKLNLFGELNTSNATSIVTQLFSVADTTWSETGITFNNKPALGSTVLGSISVGTTTPTMYTVDVTSYVKAQLTAGHKTVSFALKDPSGGTPFIGFNSKEAGSNAPTLTVS